MPSTNTLRILTALRDDKLVLVHGPPASGKTFALNEVAGSFTGLTTGSTHSGSPVPIRAEGNELSGFVPSPERSERKVFRFVMNQNTRFAHLWRDVEPEPGKQATLRISKGVLWKANQFALQADSTALVVIEELNRGPAVKALGPGIVGLESDKRGDDDGMPLPSTFPIQMMNDAGGLEDLVISPHLYVACAQNNADTSVEPIDAAWYRRFAPVSIPPEPSVLVGYFGIGKLDGQLPTAAAEADAADVFRAATRAWQRVNDRISVGRGPDYLLGHGVLIRQGEELPTDVAGALDFVRRGWSRIEAHVDEVFYDQVEAIADVLRVTAVPAGSHPYKIERVSFADIERPLLLRDGVVDDDEELYKLLRIIAEN